MHYVIQTTFKRKQKRGGFLVLQVQDDFYQTMCTKSNSEVEWSGFRLCGWTWNRWSLVLMDIWTMPIHDIQGCSNLFTKSSHSIFSGVVRQKRWRFWSLSHGWILIFLSKCLGLLLRKGIILILFTCFGGSLLSYSIWQWYPISLSFKAGKLISH